MTPKGRTAARPRPRAFRVDRRRSRAHAGRGHAERQPHFAGGVPKPGRFQPRKNFADEALSELAASIREKGVLTPILVRPLGARQL